MKLKQHQWEMRLICSVHVMKSVLTCGTLGRHHRRAGKCSSRWRRAVKSCKGTDRKMFSLRPSIIDSIDLWALQHTRRWSFQRLRTECWGPDPSAAAPTHWCDRLADTNSMATAALSSPLWSPPLWLPSLPSPLSLEPVASGDAACSPVWSNRGR